MADGITFPVSIPVSMDGGEAAVGQLDAMAANLTGMTSAIGQATSATGMESAALDELAASAVAAATAESEVATGATTLAGSAKKSGQSIESMGYLAQGAMGPMGGLFGRATMLAKGLSSGGLAGAAIAAGVAILALGTAAVTAYAALAKFAVTANKKAMERIDKATKKLDENLKSLFKTVKVDKFVSAFEDVLSVFDEGSSTSKGLQTALSTILDPLMAAAQIVAPYVKEAIKGVTWAILEVEIYAIKAGRALLSLVPDSVIAAVKDLTDGIDWMKVAFFAGAVVAGVVAVALLAAAVAVGILVVALGFLLVASLFIIAPFLIFIVVAALVVAAIVGIGYAIYKAVSALMDLGSAGIDAAGQLIDGLVNGITSGAGAVYDALKQMASNMGATIKSALGIASPSKLFAGFGENTALGFAVGVESAAPVASNALESMVAPPEMPSNALESMAAPPEMVEAEASKGKAGASGGTITLRFLMPDGSIQSKVTELGEVLTVLLEGDALQLGGGEVPA